MWPIPVLLALLCCVGAKVYQVPLTKVDPLRLTMMRNGEWAKFVKNRNAERTKISNAEYKQRINDYRDVEYIANITVGTPGEMFKVVLDTGTADFWIPDVSCVPPPKPAGCEDPTCDPGVACKVFCKKADYCCKDVRTLLDGSQRKYTCQGKNIYDPEKSRTAKPYEGTWSIKYMSGSASGVYSRDTVRFGGRDETNVLSVTNTPVGRATTISESFRKTPFDGILGLAFKEIAANQVTPPFQSAYEARDVEPKFTIHLERLGGEVSAKHESLITYGGIDTENCENDVAFVSLTRSGYFQFEVKSVSSGNFKISASWEAISDSGSAFIAVPQSIADKIAKAVGAEYSKEDEAYFMDCDGFPKVQFGIGNKNYIVKGHNFLITLEQWKCYLPLLPLDVGSFGPSIILGTPFIRQYCNIYDMGNKKIGFATSKPEEEG